VILAKNSNKVVSDVLGIEDLYEKFCIDETSDYLYFHWKDEAKNKEELKSLVSKHSKKKK